MGNRWPRELFSNPFLDALLSRRKGDPNSLPGFATRGEVQRLMILRQKDVILGMPDKVFRGGLVRYWANKYGLKIHKTLEDSVNQVK